MSGATRLRRVCCHLSVPSPSNHLNHKLTVKSSIHFQSFPILQSAISSLPVWYQLLAVCWYLLTCLLDPTECPVTLARVYSLNLGSPRVPLKNHPISSLSPGPLKIRKSASRFTKKHQNVTQIPSPGLQITE